MKHIFGLIFIFFLVSISICHGAERVALVIGNARYASVPLANPVNDAADMATSLQQCGFKVIQKLNTPHREMERAIKEFYTELKRSRVGLFYFAGHGIQMEGENYLLPVDADVSSASDVKFEAIHAGRVLGKMKDAGNDLNIVILDACRDNPFRSLSRDFSKGLARMEAPTGTIVAYATGPGSVAADGQGRNGVFTKHFLKNMMTPNTPIEMVLKRTRVMVGKETGGAQIPWDHSSLMGEFYFAGGPGPVPVIPERPVQKIVVKPDPVLSVDTLPKDATVRILNITPKFKDGMTLPRGRYLLEVSKTGYITQEKWVELSSGAYSFVFELKRDPNVPLPGRNWTDTVTGMEFVWVPGGCFQMGQTAREKAYLVEVRGQEKYDMYYRDELPRHEACVDGFWMGKTEVTRGQFRRFIQASGYRTDADKGGDAYILNKETGWKWTKRSGANWERPGFNQTEDHPVACVSWADAKAFAAWLNTRSGKSYGLPTEAQWEYAARGGTPGIWFWGDKADGGCRYANGTDMTPFPGDAGKKWTLRFECNDGFFFTAPVARYQPNPFGLYDMLGNVWEWCEDVYDSNAYSSHDRNNPVVKSGGSDRVLRGGSWGSGPAGVRSADRDGSGPSVRSSCGGFRLVLPGSR